MKIKSYSLLKFVVIATLLLPFVSCNNSAFKTDKSGMKYKFIVEHKDSIRADVGDILLLSMRYTNDKDSVISESDYFRMQLDKLTPDIASIQNGLALMHVGDSAIFIVDAKTFYNKNRKQKLPSFLKPGSKLTFYIKLIGTKSYQEFEQERRSLRSSNSHEEQELLTRYLKNSNITVKPTQSGLYYVEKLKGKGRKPQPGRTVVINYMAYFVDGKIFDSTYKRHKPFEFTYGVGEVIQGLDEGISKMREGGRATIIIPSYLAYGDKQHGPVAPFSTLIFDVELLRVQ